MNTWSGRTFPPDCDPVLQVEAVETLSTGQMDWMRFVQKMTIIFTMASVLSVSLRSLGGGAVELAVRLLEFVCTFCGEGAGVTCDEATPEKMLKMPGKHRRDVVGSTLPSLLEGATLRLGNSCFD